MAHNYPLPSSRLNRLLVRLSRNTWLAPERVRNISVQYARKICPGAWGSVTKTIPDAAMAVGMIRGHPVAWPWEGKEKYGCALRIARSKRSDESKMIEFLKLQQKDTL